MIPAPRRLFAQFERGGIEREELQALMARLPVAGRISK
jgi:hypothetical protein